MVWNWSHTEQAEINVRHNIDLLSEEDRRTVLAEILTFRYCYEAEKLKAKMLGNSVEEVSPDDEAFDDLFYQDALDSPAVETLLENGEWATVIAEFACEKRICENGGHSAWICPSGCHTVSFDREVPDWCVSDLTKIAVAYQLTADEAHEILQKLAEDTGVSFVIRDEIPVEDRRLSDLFDRERLAEAIQLYVDELEAA